MQKSYAAVAIIQTILHYLAILSVILGLIALVFGNTNRGWELIIGGVGLFVFKYIIGIIFMLIFTRKADKEDDKEQIG